MTIPNIRSLDPGIWGSVSWSCDLLQITMGFITTKLTTILGEYVYTFSKHRGQANPRQNDGLSLSSHKGEQCWNAVAGYHLDFDGFWPTTVADRWSKASILLHPNNGGGWFRCFSFKHFGCFLGEPGVTCSGVCTFFLLRSEPYLLMKLPKNLHFGDSRFGKVYLYFLYWQKWGDKSHLPDLHSHVGQAALWDTWQLKHWVSQDGCLKHQKTTTKKNTNWAMKQILLV